MRLLFQCSFLELLFSFVHDKAAGCLSVCVSVKHLPWWRSWPHSCSWTSPLTLRTFFSILGDSYRKNRKKRKIKPGFDFREMSLWRWIKRGNLTPLSLNTGSRIHLSVDVGFPSDHVVVTVSLSQPPELLKRTTAQKHVTSTLYNSSRTRCSTAPQSSTTSA